MSITAKEDISIAKEDIKESKKLQSLNTTKTLIFKHEAAAGEMGINISALNTPNSSAINGFSQPSLSDIASVNLLVNKNNIRLYSSRGGWLQLGDDFKVIGSQTIQFVGNMEALGGAAEGEIFTIYVTPVQTNVLLTTDHKRMYQEFVLAEGETVLNLGREFEVNKNPLIQIGAVRFWRNGVGPLLRNNGNAAASLLADGNYHEVDAGNGLGTSVEFNTPATGQDDVIVAEFGLEYAGDFSLVGDIESLYGAILKLANDVKELGPYPLSRYLSANPSQTERRAFGDAVLSYAARLSALELPWKVQEKVLPATITSGTTVAALSFNNLVVGKWYWVKIQMYGNPQDLDTSLLAINHDGVDLATAQIRGQRTDSTNIVSRITADAIFQATATTCNIVRQDGRVVGNGTKAQTYSRIIELPSDKFVSTTDFT